MVQMMDSTWKTQATETNSSGLSGAPSLQNPLKSLCVMAELARMPIFTLFLLDFPSLNRGTVACAYRKNQRSTERPWCIQNADGHGLQMGN